ncbi:MAG TPA: hypothetical protein VM325_01485 [Alphaproteobacteria bacterium]|nr:hypothetical protein [Alphaproteobacteria bacterium]
MKTILLAAAVVLAASASTAANAASNTREACQPAGYSTVNLASVTGANQRCSTRTVQVCQTIGHPKTGGVRRVCSMVQKRVCFPVLEMRRPVQLNPGIGRGRKKFTNR